MKRRILLTALLLSVVSLAVFAGGQGESSSATHLRIGTASMGGAYYPMGQGIANLVNEYDKGVSMVPIVTDGSVQNPRLVDNGQVDLALTNANLAYFAYNGLKPYNKKLNVRAIATLYPSVEHMITLANSPINNISDLKGKKVAVGPAGGGTLPILEAMLNAYGLSMKDITPSYLSYADGFTQLADGNVDAAFALAGYPTSAVMQIVATHKIKFIKIDPDKLNSILKKYSYYSKIVIPKDVYKLSSDATVIGVHNILLVSTKLDKQEVYEITKAVFDHLSEFAASNANAKQISLAKAPDTPIPLAAGAAEYFKK